MGDDIERRLKLAEQAAIEAMNAVLAAPHSRPRAAARDLRRPRWPAS